MSDHEEQAYKNYRRKRALLPYYRETGDELNMRVAAISIKGLENVYPHFPQRYKDEGHE